MNTGVCVFFWIKVFSNCVCPVVGLLVVLFLDFEGISLLLSIVAMSVYIPTNSAKGFPFLHTSPAFIVCRLFDDGHPDQYEVIPPCSFDLHVCNNEWCWASFHVFITHLHVFFGEMSVSPKTAETFSPIFWLGCLFFWYWNAWGACIFWRLIPCQLLHLQIFSLIERVVFHLVYNYLCCAIASKFL